MSLLLKPLAFALNTALAQDPETQVKLAQFEQRCIAIDIVDFKQTISLLIADNKLHLSNLDEQPADLTISGKAIALAKLGQHPDNLFSADIDIHGNVQFAKQLQDLLEGFDFDWEAQLAKVTGDTLAYPLAQGLRHTASWLKNTHQSLQENMAEYLREESRILPDQSEINDYLNNIDNLRADLDRLDARINRLKV